MARILDDWGYKVVAVSDSKTGIYKEGGLDIPETIKHKEQQGSLENLEAKKVSNEELLELDVDVLVPAALENQITKDNAANIKAKIVLELANGPVTPEADEILEKKGVTAIPDVLANAGGVAVSYFEWVQNNYGYYWEEDDVLAQLEKKMVQSFNDIHETVKKKDVSYREAAFILAVERIVAAAKQRGAL